MKGNVFTFCFLCKVENALLCDSKVCMKFERHRVLVKTFATFKLMYIVRERSQKCNPIFVFPSSSSSLFYIVWTTYWTELYLYPLKYKICFLVEDSMFCWRYYGSTRRPEAICKITAQGVEEEKNHKRTYFVVCAVYQKHIWYTFQSHVKEWKKLFMSFSLPQNFSAIRKVWIFS